MKKESVPRTQCWFLLFSSCSCSDSGLWLLSLLFMSADLFLAESDKRIYAVTLTLFLAIFALRIDYLSQIICFSQHCGSEQGHKHRFLWLWLFNVKSIHYTEASPPLNSDTETDFKREDMIFFVCVSVWEQRGCERPSGLCLYVSQRCTGNCRVKLSVADIVWIYRCLLTLDLCCSCHDTSTD